MSVSNLRWTRLGKRTYEIEEGLDSVERPELDVLVQDRTRHLPRPK